MDYPPGLYIIYIYISVCNVYTVYRCCSVVILCIWIIKASVEIKGLHGLTGTGTDQRIHPCRALVRWRILQCKWMRLYSNYKFLCLWLTHAQSCGAWRAAFSSICPYEYLSLVPCIPLYKKSLLSEIHWTKCYWARLIKTWHLSLYTEWEVPEWHRFIQIPQRWHSWEIFTCFCIQGQFLGMVTPVYFRLLPDGCHVMLGWPSKWWSSFIKMTLSSWKSVENGRIHSYISWSFLADKAILMIDCQSCKHIIVN